MSRVERRMYRRQRGQVFLRRTLLFLSALVVAAGLLTRWTGAGNIAVEAVTPPTATPVTAAYDETMQTREITLPQDVWYALQTGIFSSADAARDKADAYADRGAPGHVAADGEKYRVFIAAYGSREDASAVRERLDNDQDVETWLYEWVCPTLTLRLSGMAGQLDVVEAGLTMFDQGCCRLRDDAVRIDRGELTLAEAMQAVRDLDDQVRLWQRTAQERFDKPYPALIASQLKLADSWTNATDRLLGASGLTELSAGMKRHAMALYEMTVAMRQGLEGE